MGKSGRQRVRVRGRTDAGAGVYVDGEPVLTGPLDELLIRRRSQRHRSAGGGEVAVGLFGILIRVDHGQTLLRCNHGFSFTGVPP